MGNRNECLKGWEEIENESRMVGNIGGMGTRRFEGMHTVSDGFAGTMRESKKEFEVCQT